MTIKSRETLFKLIKNQLISMRKDKVINDDQFYVALVKARKALDLPVA